MNVWTYLQPPLQILDRRQVGQRRAVSRETAGSEPFFGNAATLQQ